VPFVGKIICASLPGGFTNRKQKRGPAKWRSAVDAPGVAVVELPGEEALMQ
jgi:hypothetical protein